MGSARCSCLWGSSSNAAGPSLCFPRALLDSWFILCRTRCSHQRHDTVKPGMPIFRNLMAQLKVPVCVQVLGTLLFLLNLRATYVGGLRDGIRGL